MILPRRQSMNESKPDGGVGAILQENRAVGLVDVQVEHLFQQSGEGRNLARAALPFTPMGDSVPISSLPASAFASSDSCAVISASWRSPALPRRF